MSKIEIGPITKTSKFKNYYTKTKNFLNKDININMDKLAFVSGLTLLSGTSMLMGQCTEREHLIYNIKQQVLETGISKEDFNKLNNEISVQHTRSRVFAWQDALDSIKMTGAAQKAYFEGGQNLKK